MGWLKKIVKLADGGSFAANGMQTDRDETAAPMRSSDFAAASNRAPPSRVDLRKYCTEVENQRNSNSCCANAAAGAYEYLCKRVAMENGDDVGDISRLFIYFVGRKNDQVRWSEQGTKVKDQGMTLVGAANALQAQGACLATSWPFELDNVNERPPAEAFDEASDYKITEVKMVPIALMAMKQCLAEGYPIVFGCKLTQPFFSCPGGRVLTPDPNDPKSAEHGLHAMLLVGYSDSNQTFIVRNSWGDTWGDGGYCYMPYDYLASKQFNMGQMWSARGLTEYDFTPEDEDDDNELFDPNADFISDDGYESEEEDLGDDEEDPDGKNDDALFNANFIYKKMFDKFDLDNSGTISKSECKTLLSKLGVPWFAASALFSKIDSDGSGTLNQQEFASAFGHLFGLMK